MNHILKNEYYTMTLSTLGAEMISLKNAEGKELIWQNPDGKYWGDHAPILFPICGAIKDAKGIYKGNEYPTKMHGFALISEFEVADLSDTKITLTLTDSEATKAQYPFDFKFTVTYSLDADKITFGAKVENTGNDVLPYSFGWHPGFRLFTETGADIEDYAVKFDNKNEVTWVKFYDDFDKQNDYIPYPLKNSEYKLCEEEIYKYDTMIFTGAGNKATLTAEGHPYRLDMTWTENIPVLCLWKSEFSDAKFICIEPWTHDTLRGEMSNHWEHRDAHRLNPGENEYFEYTLKFSF